jgi:hypothetical protein
VFLVDLKVQVKITLQQAMKVQRRNSDLDGWVVHATTRPLYARERDPVRILQETMWAPRPIWTGEENLASTGIRSPDLPARSESLY